MALFGVIVWAACSGDPEDDRRGEIEDDVHEAAAAHRSSTEVACGCLVTLNPAKFPDEATCLDQFDLTEHEACTVDALASEPDLAATFNACLKSTYAASEACWTPCPADNDEALDNDCFNKELAAANACFEPLPEALASAVSACMKGL